MHVCSVAQLCPTLRTHGLQPISPICPQNFPGKNTGVGCHFLLQGIFPTQGSNLQLLQWQADALPLSHLGSPFQKMIQFNFYVKHTKVHIVAILKLWIRCFLSKQLLLRASYIPFFSNVSCMKSSVFKTQLELKILQKQLAHENHLDFDYSFSNNSSFFSIPNLAMIVTKAFQSI